MLHSAFLGRLGLSALLLACATTLQADAGPFQDSAASTALSPPVDRPAGWIEHWAEFIRPTAEELSYESIGWRNQFWPAVQLAQELGRPILLWTMNGHPLGCT